MSEAVFVEGLTKAYNGKTVVNHLHETIRVDMLAELVGLNRSYLSTLFKKETGVSVSEYILSKRMEKEFRNRFFRDSQVESNQHD